MARTRTWMSLTVAAAGLAFLPGEAEARTPRGEPPFCVTRPGPFGPDTYSQLCIFYNYHECLRAATGWRSNCVVNVEYPGTVVRVPGGYEARDPVPIRRQRGR